MNYWILKTKKSLNDPFTDWIKPGYEEEWYTQKSIPSDFSKGDVGFIWESAPACRLIACGTITNPFLKDSDDGNIFIVRSSTGVIEGLPNIETLRELTIFKKKLPAFLKKGAAGTIFPLTPEQGEYLASIFRINIQPVNESAISDLSEPEGVEAPDRASRYNTLTFKRDGNVREFVKSRSQGMCELCGKLGFLMPSGQYYIETHHIIYLSKNGQDTPQNVIGLCPDHHREAHFGADAEALEVKMIDIMRAKSRKS